MYRTRSSLGLATVIGAMSCGQVARGQAYDFTVTPATSSLSGNFSASANFSGTFIGNYNQATNPGGTRTLNFCIIFCSRPAAPTNISKTMSGSGSASGPGSGRPAGAYRLSLDTGAGTVTLSALDANLIGSATPPSFPVNATVSYQSFWTAAPDYSYPFLIPLEVPLGNAVVNSVQVHQTANATGPITLGAPNQYTFSNLSVPADVTAAVDFQGAVTTNTTAQTLTASGSITVNGGAATGSLTFTLDYNNTDNTPQPLAPNTPFDLPPPPGSSGDNAHLLLNLTITSQTVMISGTSALPANGALVPPPCGSADFNCDGDTGTDADIESFFACLAGVCPVPPCASTADFNADGDVGTDADIEAFFRVLAGGAC